MIRVWVRVRIWDMVKDIWLGLLSRLGLGLVKSLGQGKFRI